MRGNKLILRKVTGYIGLRLFNEFSLQSITDQALIVDVSAQTLAKGGATEKQVLKNLSFIDWHFLANMQSNTGII